MPWKECLSRSQQILKETLNLLTTKGATRLCGEDVCECALWTIECDVSSSIHVLNVPWTLLCAGASLMEQQ